MKTAAKAALTLAAREGRDLLSRIMHTEEWRLAGTLDVREVQSGLWYVETPPGDPLRLEHVPTGRKLVVPFAAMETDFASIPRALQKVRGKALHLRPRDYERAAFFHDQLYAAAWCWAVNAGRAVRVPVSKRQADAILFVAMECEGATLADGLAYHATVSLFGGSAWRQCRRERAEWPELFGNSEQLDGRDA